MRRTVSVVPRVALASWCWLSGCLELPPPLASSDASPPDGHAEGGPPDAPVLGVEVLDARGDPHPLDAIPRRPRIRVRSAAILSGDPEPIHLVAGLDEASLRDDLESAPLRESTLARSVEHERVAFGDTLELRPREPLAPGVSLHLAIGAWARDAHGDRLGEPYLIALRVDAGDRGGARALDTWPPDGASSVPSALPLAAVRFDGVVEGLGEGLWIEDASGARAPARARSAACEEIGWTSGHCAVLEPTASLAPGTAHRLRSGPALLDATGAIVPALDAAFVTADHDEAPPTFVTASCALDELALDAGCVLADDARIVLRVRASEAVRLTLSTELGVARAVAPRGDAELMLEGLPASTALRATLEAIDLAGHVTRLDLELATTEPLAAITITEVRADPHGTEPRQEYVEIANLGTTAVDLAGFALSDASTEAGDLIAGPARLAAGARALIVASDFDPDDRGEEDRDAPVPPGLMLVRVDRSLGAAGLSNSGEPLYLRDALGRRISAAPAEPAPRTGVCTVRVAGDPRTGARGSFDYDAQGRCTPGR